MKVCLYESVLPSLEPTGKEIVFDSPTVRIAMQVHLEAIKKEYPDAKLSLRGKSIYTEEIGSKKGFRWGFSIIEK